jgi:hypothetical protein
MPYTHCMQQHAACAIEVHTAVHGNAIWLITIFLTTVQSCRHGDVVGTLAWNTTRHLESWWVEAQCASSSSSSSHGHLDSGLCIKLPGALSSSIIINSVD